MTILVHSNAQLKSFISLSRNNLEKQGVPVTRRQVENAISPALSGGQSHEVLTAKLKEMPKSAQSMMFKKVTSKGMQNKESIDFVSEMGELQIQSEQCMKFLNQWNTYNKKLTDLFQEVVEKSDAINSKGYQEDEVISVFRLILDALKNNKRIDMFRVKINHNGEKDEEGCYSSLAYAEFCVKINCNVIDMSATIDPDSGDVDGLYDCYINGDLIEGNNVLDYVSDIMGAVMPTIGLNNAMSNEFNTKLSVETLSAIFNDLKK